MMEILLRSVKPHGCRVTLYYSQSTQITPIPSIQNPKRPLTLNSPGIARPRLRGIRVASVPPQVLDSGLDSLVDSDLFALVFALHLVTYVLFPRPCRPSPTASPTPAPHQ